MDAKTRARWWKNTGRPQLTLLLWAAWDPIGGVPLDEYENYADRLFSQLERGEEAESIAEQLENIRTSEMGLPRDRARDLDVAGKLRWWHYWAVKEPAERS